MALNSNVIKALDKYLELSSVYWKTLLTLYQLLPVSAQTQRQSDVVGNGADTQGG